MGYSEHNTSQNSPRRYKVCCTLAKMSNYFFSFSYPRSLCDNLFSKVFLDCPGFWDLFQVSKDPEKELFCFSGPHYAVLHWKRRLQSPFHKIPLFDFLTWKSLFYRRGIILGCLIYVILFWFVSFCTQPKWKGLLRKGEEWVGWITIYIIHVGFW